LGTHSDERVYTIFRTNGSPHHNVVSIIDFSQNSETYLGFHGEPNSFIIATARKSSSAYVLFGVRNNQAFTYYMDTSNSSNDEGLNIASSISMNTSPELCDYDGSGFMNWMACAD